MDQLTFTVIGKPKPKQSFRATKDGGGYTAKDVKRWQNDVGWAAKRAMSERDIGLMQGVFEVYVTFYLPTRHRIDLDNLSKAILDGCNKVVWADDTSVMLLHLEKRYDKKQPRAEVIIKCKTDNTD